MKIKPIVYFSLLNLPISMSFALTLTDAPISNVTLYPNTAKIERNIPVKSGENIVTLQGLAANFDISQLQYQTENNIEVNAVSHQDSALDKPSGAESRELKTQIEQIENKISEQNSIIQAAELQNNFLTNLTKGSANKVRKQAYDAFIAIDQAKAEKVKLEQRLQELRQDLAAVGDHQFKQRSLKFYVKAPQNGIIKMSYLVPYARWQPIYKAELDTQTKQVKLTRMAMIAQKTGEDWSNVKLTLSTATPQGYVQQLTPQNWWVDYYEPQPIRVTPFNAGYSFQEAAMPAPVAKLSNTQDSLAQEPQFPQFQANNLNLSTEFRSDTQTTIYSSQQQIYLPLSSESFPAKLSLWVIPKQSQKASMIASIAKLDDHLPHGLVKLYRDGDFVGERQWQNGTSDHLEISFGTDDQIKIHVIDLSDQKRPVADAKFQTVQKQQYSIENLHPYPVQLTVFEAEPQSRNGKLMTHSTYQPQPNHTTWQGQPNINQWNVELASKQKFNLDLQHQFTYPNKGNISGF